MEFRFDQFGSEPQSESSVPVTGAALEWPGLMARLAAAHATRRVLAEPSCHRDTTSGSFSPAYARHIAATPECDDNKWAPVFVYKSPGSRQPKEFSCHSINQNAKVNGKPHGTIAENSKGKDPTAVRGLL